MEENTSMFSNKIISTLVAVIVLAVVLVPICNMPIGGNGGSGNSNPGEMNPGLPLNMITSEYHGEININDSTENVEIVLVTPSFAIASIRDTTGISSTIGVESDYLFWIVRYNIGISSDLSDMIFAIAEILNLDYDGYTLNISFDNFEGNILDEQMEASGISSMSVQIDTDWIAIPDNNGEWAMSKSVGLLGNSEFYVGNSIEYPLDIHVEDITDIWVCFDAYSDTDADENGDVMILGYYDGMPIYQTIDLYANSMGESTLMGSANSPPEVDSISVNFNETGGVINTGNISIEYTSSGDTYDGFLNYVIYPRYYGGADAQSDVGDGDNGILSTMLGIIPVFVAIGILSALVIPIFRKYQTE